MPLWVALRGGDSPHRAVRCIVGRRVIQFLDTLYIQESDQLDTLEEHKPIPSLLCCVTFDWVK